MYEEDLVFKLFFLMCFQFFFVLNQVRLEEWEKKREEERRRLMVEEAEKKEEDGVWASMNKQGQKLLGRWVLG